MNREKALEIVKEHLTNHRYVHTCGVMETSIELAKRYGADEKKAEIAAIFHDYAKFRDKKEMERIIIGENLPQDLLVYNSELWHAPVGAMLVQREVGIEDEDILNAIRFHTSGKEEMTTLDKVIYLADYIEPNRQFPGVEEVRELSKESLDLALIKSLQNTITFLLKKDQAIYPDTFRFYNGLIINQRR
ncbi:HD domain-containing protein [Bacillus sp. BHET2]|uniref:bis(5'-nucleosyl)-tetraphosphatase (symmetrical) YqeK n=1 Tax=Bacillus sp. BHET2 TaxID=2583818 RepID=UPI00110E8E15|nr:bis(5'-nucleosyl)-tetraphosphatase (symmetrical) YqeK [Bacillus sp. BHET2]TMU85612.1 HD domain-containing protein [Bacillus sp. BHET2]